MINCRERRTSKTRPSGRNLCDLVAAEVRESSNPIPKSAVAVAVGVAKVIALGQAREQISQKPERRKEKKENETKTRRETMKGDSPKMLAACLAAAAAEFSVGRHVHRVI